MQSIGCSWRWFGVAVFVLGAVSCSASSDRPAASVAMDADRSSAQRLNAIKRIPPQDLDVLFRFVTSARHPIAVREAGVDRLIQHDAEAFWTRVDVHLKRIDDWPMIRLLCERAAADGVTNFVPTAIKSWARPSTQLSDADRPERLAIALLVPTASAEVQLRSALLDRREGRAEVRAAAWAVLSRVETDDQLRALLTQSQSSDPLLGPLAAIAPAVDRLPAQREEMLRLRTLVEQSTPEQWRERAEYRRRAGQQDSVGSIEARHLPAVNHANKWRDATRERLLEEMQRRLKGRTHDFRGVDAGNQYIEQRPERLADHADQLGRGDLLVLVLLNDAMEQPSFRERVFTQADADLIDTTTEHGGVLTWNGDSNELTPVIFEPLLRRHDRIYIASDRCVEAMHTGLAHYHLHAQQVDCAAWTGPGGGDLQFADRIYANCVVFTFIDRNTLNVDAYFPGGRIVDLGRITRP